MEGENDPGLDLPKFKLGSLVEETVSMKPISIDSNSGRRRLNAPEQVAG